MKPILTTAVLIASFSTGAFAQTLEQRIADLRDKQHKADVDERIALANSQSGKALSVPVQFRGGGGAQLEGIQAAVAFEWLSRAIDVPILVNWRALEAVGITREDPVSIVGNNLTGEMALDIVIQQLDIDGQLLWEPTGTYVRVFTKEQAQREPIVRVYTIGDLLMTVPNFDDAPSFDLVEVTRAPASGGGSQSNIFEEEDDEASGKSMAERGEEIAQIIRDSVEPDLWAQAGGLGGSIRYWNQSLIVRAPAYVHRQIAGDSSYSAPASVRPGTMIKQPGRDAVLVQNHADAVRDAVRVVHNDRVFGDVEFTSLPARAAPRDKR